MEEETRIPGEALPGVASKDQAPVPEAVPTLEEARIDVDVDEGVVRRLRAFLAEKMGTVRAEDVGKALESGVEGSKRLVASGVEKARIAGRQAVLFCDMLRAWKKKEFDCPWRTVAAVASALLYLSSPIDVIPDFIPLAGLLDDVVVIALCLAVARGDLRRFAEGKGYDPRKYGV